MKMGLNTAILDGWTYEEMIDEVARQGLECVEVAAWPQGKAERRYAGVSHIDADRVLADDDYAKHVLDYAAGKGVKISSIAFYPNNMDADLEKRAAANAHTMTCIRAAAKLGVNMVTTFIGRMTDKTLEENLEELPAVWNPILKLAEDEGVRIGIENCPMFFDASNWPGGQNIMTSPANWRRVFEILPSENLGICYDPSHFVWQLMDYIAPIEEFADKLFLIHFKDIKLFEDKLADKGSMAYPLEYMAPKIPGLGDVDWSSFMSAITEAGYTGDSVIEVEDRAFEGSRERVLASIELSARYLRQFVI